MLMTWHCCPILATPAHTRENSVLGSSSHIVKTKLMKLKINGKQRVTLAAGTKSTLQYETVNK